jgi:hypothetical protein
VLPGFPPAGSAFAILGTITAALTVAAARTMQFGVASGLIRQPGGVWL